MMRFMATPVGARLGAALKATYQAAGVSQEQLAAELGVDQTTISSWARGMRRAPLDVLPEIERVCGVRKGTILRAAGYVDDDPSDVRAAIRADPTLVGLLQDVMLSTYDGIQRALARASNDSANPESALPSS